MSLKSEIKVGSQFEFSIHGEKRIRQKAVVTQFLSNREEGKVYVASDGQLTVFGL
jgi:hypothetical protein